MAEKKQERPPAVVVFVVFGFAVMCALGCAAWYLFTVTL